MATEGPFLPLHRPPPGEIMSEDQQSPSRRNLIKQLFFIPIGVAGGAGAVHALNAAAVTTATAPAGQPNPYTATFFNADEWRFLLAACDRLIPHDEHGPGAVELGVPEFLDRHMQTPYASGDIWYMQGPFMEAPPEFGYQGRLPLRDILRVGIKALDGHSMKTFNKKFADLDAGQQDGLLKASEGGKLKLQDMSEKLFFTSLLN